TMFCMLFFFFFQAEDGIRDYKVTGVQTCALPISSAATMSQAATGDSTCVAREPRRSRRSRSHAARINRPGYADTAAFLYACQRQIGRASCRERVEMSGVEGCITKKHIRVE